MIIEHKARLCAQGFSQTPGVDFSKTFAPTGRLNSLCTLISFAASRDLCFEQLDIKSAFLNATLEEDVYLSIPQGLDRDKSKTCLKLNKAIYGLPDSCVFHLAGEDPIWLFLHVDNIGVFGKNLTKFKTTIELDFSTKMIGEADLMLGIKIGHQPESMTLSQRHYIEPLLDLYGMTSCKPVDTPLMPNSHMQAASESKKEELEKLGVNYCSAVGSLSYLSVATRPDLAFPVSALSQFLENPGIEHWKCFLHVLKYLKGTSAMEPTYQRNSMKPPIAYSDADWGNCKTTRQSVTGYLITIHNNLVIWEACKQPTVSLSSAEGEYRSLTDLTSEIMWFRQFCKEVDIIERHEPITVHKDNQGCIDTANGDCNYNSQRMKHVDIQLHFIREVISASMIQLTYTPTSQMLADFLTKAVCRPAMRRAMTNLGLLQTGDTGCVEREIVSQSVSN
ncbi:hypothetical protein O181_076169 [Austropuccinia psidii MF-1]|uniref:Reverse transcriptase Ty1/copia-type domain-containing protein n=1 Tax=Austropuccinia psidii MF-1 TaxID=1389203 RepID=A0A9Q3IF57_9BASI|nr:hypothetical protein [Austropuccinia psidii MF-1]